MEAKTVGIIGGGAWGTALGTALAKGGHTVEVWALEDDVVASINNEHENKRYLPGYKLAETMTASTDIKKVATGKEFIIMASPSLYLASTISRFVDVPNVADHRSSRPSPRDLYLPMTVCHASSFRQWKTLSQNHTKTRRSMSQVLHTPRKLRAEKSQD